jgi:hypothetical protein
MKKTLAILFLLQLCMGCKKELENNAINQPESPYKYARQSICYNNVTLQCSSFLKFTDIGHFKSVYDCLLNNYEDNCTTFENTHDYLSETAYNKTIDSLSFKDEQPLITFENNFTGFSSLRKWYETREDLWLNTGPTGSFAHPEVSVLIDDPVLMTLFNDENVVQIGTDIIWITDGTTFVIANGTCTILEDVQANPSLYASGSGQYPGVTTIMAKKWVNSNSGECVNWVVEQGSSALFDTDKFIYYKSAFRNYGGFWTTAVAKTISYKKLQDGKKKRWARKIFSISSAKINNSNCNVSGTNVGDASPSTTIDCGSGNKKRRKRVARWRGFGNQANSFFIKYATNGANFSTWHEPCGYSETSLGY